jgi:hypothetical protein
MATDLQMATLLFYQKELKIVLKQMLVYQCSKRHYPNNQKIENFPESINRGMNKQNVTYTYNEMFFTHKNSDTNYSKAMSAFCHYIKILEIDDR